ncbi:MAG: ribonuclease PH [Candidatus Nitrohelix vancouverensis]|uniref:Ribonuclease PH n=1 Tax=Candidatus Nitrohelix vancouverensis TaxID=2705534 RepID=A0A7T0G458_9BACT|nr:MAG: ribonuclease PH [Candidatus Nitrohelix vancouverensis]
MDRPSERGFDEIRKVKVVKNYTMHPHGSVLIQMGNTKVICAATVEEKIPPFLRGKDSGWVTAEYSMLPSATNTRSPREASRGKLTGRTQEIQRLIGRSLRTVVDLKALGERTIWLDCDVIQADGGTRCASITGAYIALVLALKKLKKDKLIDTIPVRDYVAAISVGILDGKTNILDLDYAEDSTASVDLNVVKTGSGGYVEIQGTAERDPFSETQLNAMLKLAGKGIAQLVEIQKKAIGPL